jgi:uncharacterized membrane protein
MAVVISIILLFVILFLAYVALKESGDGPDDDLEPPQGGVKI